MRSRRVKLCEGESGEHLILRMARGFALSVVEMRTFALFVVMLVSQLIKLKVCEREVRAHTHTHA